MVALDHSALFGHVKVLRLKFTLAPLVAGIAVIAAVLVMALAVVPLKRLGGVPVLEKARRAVLGAAAVYFWLCYCIMALARLSGPHRPDAFYGISLSLMVVALLLRYADRWFSDHPR